MTKFTKRTGDLPAGELQQVQEQFDAAMQALYQAIHQEMLRGNSSMLYPIQITLSRHMEGATGYIQAEVIDKDEVMALREAVASALHQIEICDYQCEAGPLINNVAFAALKGLVTT